MAQLPSGCVSVRHLITIFIKGESDPGYAEITLENQSVAAAKNPITAALGLLNVPTPKVTLWKVDGAGGLVQLDDCRPIEGQLANEDKVVVKAPSADPAGA